MSNTDFFEVAKIASAATNKAALNVYLDSFAKKKVKLRIDLFDTNLDANRRSITAYIDFDELSVLAADAASGRLISKIQSNKAGMRLGYKGSEHSKAYNGKPESRYISFGMVNDKVFVNMFRCQGVVTSTGGYAPDDKRDQSGDLKLSVGMTVDKFRSIILYSYDCVKAYLVNSVNVSVKAVDNLNKNRGEKQENTNS